MNAQDLTIKFNELLDITRQSYDTFLSQTEAALLASRPLILAVDEQDADPETLQLDLALIKAAPVAVVPVHTEFAPLLDAGHRFLLAKSGLLLEVRRPWLHAILPLAQQDAVSMPFGTLETKQEMAFGRLSAALPQMVEFAARALGVSPLEAAASVIWNDQSGAWDIRYPEVIGEATTARIQYKQVELAEHEHLVIDLHSHGAGPAFFSGTDDIDDAGTVKISGVFGNLDAPMPTVAFRLCVLGKFIPITVPAEKIFGPTLAPAA